MKKQIALFGLIVLVAMACRQTEPTPDPASIIQGDYTAESFKLTGEPVNYPINGKTITMQIRRVAKDTVQVDIQAVPNGQYSPGQSLSYPKAYIVSQSNGKGQYTFNVFLTPRSATSPTSLVDAIQFYTSSKSIADYYYVPLGGDHNIHVSTRFKPL